MSGEVIVALVTVVALFDLFRLRAGNTTLSRAGLLVAAVPRAIVPMAAAGALGARALIRVYEGIAETGSAGLVPVASGTSQAVLMLFAGVLGFLLTLIVAFVMAARQRVTDDVEPDRRSRLADILGMMLIVAGLGGAWMAVHWTDKVGVGMLESISRSSNLPPAPIGYRFYGPMSGEQAAQESERLMTSQQLGSVLVVVSGAVCFLTSRLFSRVWRSDVAYTVVSVSTIVLGVTAAVYSAHLWSGARWLQALMRG
jgi:hypothetical protein